MADRVGDDPRHPLRGAAQPALALSPDAATRDLHDFGYSPGFQSTLGSTVASRAPTWLDEIQVPVRVAYGTLDLMLGVFTAPRFAAAIREPNSCRC